jgi:molecular chaperone DnaJ
VARDYYGLLGVSRNASDAEIKRAYRKLARELHPDVNPDQAAQAKFQEISAAYEVLSDPEKRRIVDLGGDPLANAAAAGGGFGGFGGGLGDVFEAFFGGGFSGGATSRGPIGRVRPGSDSLLRMRLDLEECATGVTKQVTVDTAVLCDRCQGKGTNGNSVPVPCDTCGGRGEVQTVQRSFLGQVMTSRPCGTCHGYGEVLVSPCFECSGDGRVRTRRTLKIKVPAGVDTGTRIQLGGEGEVGPGGGPAGDLYVEVAVRPHATFHRRGDDLHCTVELPMTAAALGTSLTLQSLDGDENLDVQPGTQSGQVVTLRGRGVTHLRSSGRGDMVVHIDVQTPTRLDEEQERLLRELAQRRGEERPEARLSPAQSGLFSRLRDAFSGR